MAAYHGEFDLFLQILGYFPHGGLIAVVKAYQLKVKGVTNCLSVRLALAEAGWDLYSFGIFFLSKDVFQDPAFDGMEYFLINLLALTELQEGKQIWLCERLRVPVPTPVNAITVMHAITMASRSPMEIANTIAQLPSRFAPTNTAAYLLENLKVSVLGAICGWLGIPTPATIHLRTVLEAVTLAGKTGADIYRVVHFPEHRQKK